MLLHALVPAAVFLLHARLSFRVALLDFICLVRVLLDHLRQLFLKVAVSFLPALVERLVSLFGPLQFLPVLSISLMARLRWGGKGCPLAGSSRAGSGRRYSGRAFAVWAIGPELGVA